MPITLAPVAPLAQATARMHGIAPRMNLTRLDRDELGRRIRAARILRDLEQRDLDDLFEQDGVGRSAGFLERGSPRAPLTRARLDSLVRHLRVPEAWFTDVDIDEIIWGVSQGRAAVEIAALRRDVAELLGRLQGPEAPEGLGRPPEIGI